MRRAFVPLMALAAASLTGCSVSAHIGPASPSSLSGSEVASRTLAALKANNAAPDGPITCPSLEAEVGKSVICDGVDHGQHYNITVTITSVHGSDVQFHVSVADHPNPPA